jgi:mycoredoxin
VLDRQFICPCYRHETDIAETGHCICHLFVSEDYQPLELGAPPPRQEGSPWPHIVMYGAYWCSHTIAARQFLNAQGIPYDYVDVDQDTEAAEKVRGWNNGNQSTPTLDIEGCIVTEPSPARLAQILGRAAAEGEAG